MKSKPIENSQKKYFTVELVVFVLLVLFELVHIKILFQNYDFLAGGDNYTQLKVLSKEIYPYVWDNTLSLGGRTVSLPNLLGIPFYARILSFLSPQLVQRLLIFSLYLARYIAFIKLAKFVSKKFSILSIIPALLLFSFNAYESLNPFALFPLVFSVYLPLSLYYFIKMLENDKIDYVNISKLIFLSIIFSTLNSNLALSITIFIPQIVYIIFKIKTFNKKKIVSLVIYYVTVLVTSLWWLLTLISYYLEAASSVFKNNWFTDAIDVGQLFENYRFIGQWGWYTGSFLYPYYPFSSYYDKPLIILITYLIILMAFFAGFTLEKETRQNILKNFFLILSLLGLFLVGGSRAPFGSLYEILFIYVPVLKIFREPFTKFNEIYVLSISILFYYFLLYLEQRVVGKKKYFVFFFVFLITLFSVKPSLVGEHVWSKWNGSMRTFRVTIPEYWLELNNYVNKNIENSRILSFPKVFYGSAWNWVNGFSSADDVSINFINNKNMVLRDPLPSGFGSGKMVDNVYESEFLSPKYLALLGADYVLLENDLDWRYSSSFSYTPDKSLEVLNNLELEKPINFGNFTSGYLANIQNNEIDENTKYEMNYELYGKPQLSLYKVKAGNINKQFFSTSRYIYLVGDESDINKASSFSDFSPNSATFLIANGKLPDIFENPSDVFISGKKEIAQISKNELKWNSSWGFLDTNISPLSIEYIFVRIDEFFHKIYSKSDILSNIDQLVMLSAKRVDEIVKYKLVGIHKNDAILDMNSNISEAFKLIQSVPTKQRDSSYWETVKKTIMFINRNEQVVSNPEEQKIYLELTKWIENNVDAECLNFCYKLKVPATGTYGVYLDKQIFDKFGFNSFIIEDKLDAKEHVAYTNKISADEKFWTKIGESNLKKDGQYRVSVLLKESKNLLEQGEWKSYTGITNRDELFQEFFPSSYIPMYGYVFDSKKTKSNTILTNSTTNNSVKYKLINGWEAGKTYKISFDYKVEKGGLGISIIEDHLDYKEMFKEKLATISINAVADRFISRALYQKEFDLNSLIGETDVCDDAGVCTYHFEDVTNSSRNAEGAKLFFYSFTNDRSISSVKIDNIKVEEVLDPKLFLKYSTVDKVIKKENPNISFKKINPTKYNLTVTGAKIPYILVFNESFNKDWKLTYQNKLVVPKSKHLMANGYANAWLIDPSYVDKNQNYSLIVEFSSQKYFVVFFILTVLVFIIVSINIIFDFSRQQRKRNL